MEIRHQKYLNGSKRYTAMVKNITIKNNTNFPHSITLNSLCELSSQHFTYLYIMANTFAYCYGKYDTYLLVEDERSALNEIVSVFDCNQ